MAMAMHDSFSGLQRSGPLFTRRLIFSVAGFWLLIGVIFGVLTHQLYSSYPTTASLSLVEVMIIALPQWIGWGFFSFVIFALCERFPVDRRPVWRNLSIHLACLIVWAIVHLVLDYQWQSWLTPMPAELSMPNPMIKFMMRKFHLYLLLYPAIVGVYQAIAYYRRSKFHAIKSNQLKAELTHAQLETLRFQLQPHFLFNTLHGISSLMYDDPESADEMLTKLSDFLRATLRGPVQPEIPLAQELELLDLYLAIEAIRFRDRLTVLKDIDPAALTCAVPVFLLQPLAENAIRHGIERKTGAGRLTLSAKLEQDQLTVSLIDDGAGLDANAAEGMGLRNSRNRLTLLYGDQAGLSLSSNDGDGTKTTVWLPAHQVGDGDL